MDVKIEKVKPEDEEELMEFLKGTFFKDEPLNASLDLGECKPLEHFCRQGFNSGFSFKATDPQTGRIVGAKVYNVIRRTDVPDADEEKLYRSHDKFYKIIEISDYAFERVDLFGRYPKCQEILHGMAASVDPAYRGRGIATQLGKVLDEEAKQQGVCVMYCQTSSHFAAKSLQTLEFTEVFSIAYEHFKKDGVQTLNPPAPHDQLRVFIKWLGEIPK